MVKTLTSKILGPFSFCGEKTFGGFFDKFPTLLVSLDFLGR